MSDRTRYPAHEAQKVAAEIYMRLDPACVHVLVVGSLRRQKPDVGDVELLFIPKTEKRTDPQDMFKMVDVNLADEVIATMENDGVLERRKNVAGRETFGPLNKLMVHKASGIPIDLFCEPKVEDWPRSLVIRTGPKELNVRLITTAARYGVKVHAYGTGLTAKDGSTIFCDSEEEFFRICGVAYLEPKDRK